MSAEGTKKRGVAGASNAKNIPFRYHGYPRGYNVSTAVGRSDRFYGARYLDAMILGAMIGGPGYAPSDRAYRAADEEVEKRDARARGAAPVLPQSEPK